MKKISLLFMLVLMVGLIGCSPVYHDDSSKSNSNNGSSTNNSKVDEVLNYLNNDVVELDGIIKKLSDSYNSYKNNTSMSRQERFDGLVNDTGSILNDLDNKISEISNKITDDQIKKVHKKYTNYSGAFRSLLIATEAVLQSNDISGLKNQIKNLIKKCQQIVPLESTKKKKGKKKSI